jgi:hypothetical protein
MCSVYNKPEDVAYDYSLFRPQKEMFFLWSWIINDILQVGDYSTVLQVGDFISRFSFFFANKTIHQLTKIKGTWILPGGSCLFDSGTALAVASILTSFLMHHGVLNLWTTNSFVRTAC